jgi:hypothetical protein
MEISENDVLKLDVKFNRMMDAIEIVKDKQDAMAEDITKIKEAVYNPDEGLYARIKELENWKKTHSKLMWMVVSAMLGLVSAAIFTNLIQ